MYIMKNVSRRLNHLSQIDFPTLISRTIPFPILGVLVDIFIFIQIVVEYSVGKQCSSVASDLWLHCLPMSHKRTLGVYGFRKVSHIFKFDTLIYMSKIKCKHDCFKFMPSIHYWNMVWWKYRYIQEISTLFNQN